MPKFTYKAKNGPSKTIEGELEADTHSIALAKIDAMGYSPVWVQEKALGDEKKQNVSFLKKVSHRDVTIFTRQLASLTKSGVPILKALHTICEQTEKPDFQRVVKDLEVTITDGKMLSEAMSKYPELFPELFVNMIRAGESGGVLDTVLFRLAETRENEEEVRRKVQSATAYPILIIVVGIITVFVLLTFFLPKIMVLFKDIDDLPLPTRMLMGITDFFSGSWYWMVFIIVLIVAVFKRLASLEKGRTFFDRIKLHMPLIKRFVVLPDIARFARTLSLLIEAGIPIDTALDLSANALRNTILQEEIRVIRRNTINQGHTLSEGLKKVKYFPVFVANMTAVGEEAGSMDESLNEVAVFYEREIDQYTRLVTSLLEPALILVVGTVVGFIVAAMLLPIFKIGSGM